MTYTIEPTDHWRDGDRAYCVRGLKIRGRYIVETGRVYHVTSARRLRGMMCDALRIEGVDEEFWSSRFVCLRGRDSPCKQIEQRTRRGWADAYDECRNARSAA